MKIRPTDSSSNLPPEPEEVGRKKTGPDFSIEQRAEGVGVSSPAQKDNLTEAFSSLKGVRDKSELGSRFMGLALKDFEESIPTADLKQVESFLQEQIQEDPYIQNKLERVSGLLARVR